MNYQSSVVDVIVDAQWKGASKIEKTIKDFDSLADASNRLSTALSDISRHDVDFGRMAQEAAQLSSAFDGTANSAARLKNELTVDDKLDDTADSAEKLKEELKGLEKTKADEPLDKLGDSAKKASGGMLTFTDLVTADLLAEGLMAIGSLALEAGAAVIEMASDAEEAASKFDSVFGSLGAGVQGPLDEFALAAGRSRFELKSFAADVGDLLQPLGFGGEALQNMSVDLVKLAVDLSSFNNITMDDALRRLNGTLIGSHENALAFGVVINENTLKAELAANGWDKLTGMALENAKVQARYNLLIKGTTAAQGDAIRTADGFANQSRALQAAVTDLGTELGAELLPAATEFVKIGMGIIKDVTPYLKTEFVQLGKDLGNLAMGFKALAQSGDELDIIAQKVDAIIAGDKDPLQKLKILQNAMEESGILGSIAGYDEEIQKGLNEVYADIVAGSTNVVEAQKKLEAAGVFSWWDGYVMRNTTASAALRESRNEAGEAAESFDRFTGVMAISAAVGQDAVESFDHVANSLRESGEAADEVVRNGEAVADVLGNVEKKAAFAAVAMERTNAVAKDKAIAELANNLKAAGKEANDFSGDILDGRRAMSEAAAEAKKYQDALLGAFNESEGVFDDLFEAQDKLAESSGEWKQITIDNMDEVNKVSKELAGDLSDDQKKAYEDILSSVSEGSGEWLNAYNALQGDLSEAQRQALVARKAELEAEGPTMASVYSGDLKAAEEAQKAIDAANQAIIQSYREMAFEATLAQNGVTASTLELGVKMGLITPEQAEARLAYAETTLALEELTGKQEYLTSTTQDQFEAIQLLSLGYADSAEQALVLAQDIDGDLSTSLTNAKSLTDDLKTSLDGINKDFIAKVNVEGIEKLMNATSMARDFVNTFGPDALSGASTGADLAEAIDQSTTNTNSTTNVYNQNININTVDNAAGVVDELSQTGGAYQ